MLILGYNEITKDFHSLIVDKDVPQGDHFLRGDPTDRATLLRAGIEKEDTLIVALEDDEDSIYAVALSRELNPKIKIGAIVKKAENVDKIYAAGADYVILESNVLSREIIRFLLVPRAASFFDRVVLSDELEIIGVDLPKEYEGKRIMDTDIRKRIGTVIAVKRKDKLIKTPSPKLLLQKGDILLFLVERKEINKIREMMGQWIYHRD